MARLVLLTGGAGLIGQRLLPVLHEAGWRVRALAHRRDVPGADEVVAGALDDSHSLARAVLGADAVIHLAGMTHSRSPRAYHAVNAVGTRTLAQVAQRQTVARFVHVSSRAIAPEGGAYSRSKLAAERELEQIGIEYVIVRLPEMYGAGGTEGVDEIRARAAAGRPILVVGRGDQEICPVHIDDVLEPLARALDAGNAANKTYTLAGECVSVRGFAERCAAASEGGSRVVGVPERLVGALSFAARVIPLPLYPDQLDRLRAAKLHVSPEARNDLGFSPRPLEDALPR